MRFVLQETVYLGCPNVVYRFQSSAMPGSGQKVCFGWWCPKKGKHYFTCNICFIFEIETIQGDKRKSIAQMYLIINWFF